MPQSSTVDMGFLDRLQRQIVLVNKSNCRFGELLTEVLARSKHDGSLDTHVLNAMRGEVKQMRLLMDNIEKLLEE